MDQQILSAINSFHRNPLRNDANRKQLARSIQSITNYFSVQEIILFLEEMRGLDLKDRNDRQLFFDMLHCWLKPEVR